VDFLINNGADVEQRATGTFFLPEDQKGDNPRKQTNYDGILIIFFLIKILILKLQDMLTMGSIRYH